MDSPRRPIELLPDEVINQIAAGEVIERPASVIKELIDNALDAGAKTITVELEAGGRGALRVVDDGIGMAPDDVVLALTRHATSKLRDVRDLVGITTMGFRGEALPAIASVARVTITTRRSQDTDGWRVVVDAGQVVEAGVVGAPLGTSISVRDLFASVPARLKFLKGEATETSHIVDAVSRVAMVHPERHLRLLSAGRTLIDVPAVATQLERARALLGPRLGAELHEVIGEEAGVRVHALLASPSLAQTTARGVQLFVGRRPVRDRGLLHAVTMAYGELIPRGRYPVAVVMLDVPGDGVDVNVHPQKLEVRFSDPGAVHAALRHVARRGVGTAPWSGRGAPSFVQMTAVAAGAPPRVSRMEAPSRPMLRTTTTSTRAQGALDLRPAADSDWAKRMRAELLQRERPEASSVVAEARPPREIIEPTPTPAGYFSGLRYLGQLDLTFLVCEGDHELVLIDQHVASERVVLSGLRERAASSTVATQRLLFPTTLTTSASAHAAAIAGHDWLAQIGFEVAAGPGFTLNVTAIPAGLRHDPSTVLRELLADLAAANDGEPLVDRALATIACHTASRAGDKLGPDQAQSLLSSMDAVDFREPGLHGRPVILRLSVGEIARRFGR